MTRTEPRPGEAGPATPSIPTAPCSPSARRGEREVRAVDDDDGGVGGRSQQNLERVTARGDPDDRHGREVRPDRGDPVPHAALRARRAHHLDAGAVPSGQLEGQPQRWLVCSAAVLPREDTTSKPAESQKFITHSKPKGAEGFDDSLGYLFAEYSYGGGYYATLHTAKSDAITGSISDSALSFGDEYPQGFQVTEPNEQYTSSIAQIYSGQDGTPGMAIEDGLLVWNSPSGTPITWFGKYFRRGVVRAVC